MKRCSVSVLVLLWCVVCTVRVSAGQDVQEEGVQGREAVRIVVEETIEGAMDAVPDGAVRAGIDAAVRGAVSGLVRGLVDGIVEGFVSGAVEEAIEARQGRPTPGNE